MQHGTANPIPTTNRFVMPEREQGSNHPLVLTQRKQSATTPIRPCSGYVQNNKQKKNKELSRRSDGSITYTESVFTPTASSLRVHLSRETGKSRDPSRHQRLWKPPEGRQVKASKRRGQMEIRLVWYPLRCSARSTALSACSAHCLDGLLFSRD